MTLVNGAFYMVTVQETSPFDLENKKMPVSTLRIENKESGELWRRAVHWRGRGFDFPIRFLQNNGGPVSLHAGPSTC